MAGIHGFYLQIIEQLFKHFPTVRTRITSFGRHRGAHLGARWVDNDLIVLVIPYGWGVCSVGRGIAVKPGFRKKYSSSIAYYTGIGRGNTKQGTIIVSIVVQSHLWTMYSPLS